MVKLSSMPPKKTDVFSDYDSVLNAADTITPPWRDRRYVAELDIFRQLLAITLGSKQQSGRTAKAFDAWVAHELRRAGFAPDAVWPRTRRPRILPADLKALEEAVDGVVAAADAAPGDLPNPLRRAIRTLDDQRFGEPGSYILGDFYAKQVDVVISSWRRGPELLVSTKTMFSSYRNNFKNRHEEAVGEVSTLRRRHPMAAMGFAFLARSNLYVANGDYELLRNILTRLRRPGEAYDATLLLVADWHDDDPAGTLKVLDEPDVELGAGRFFEDLISAFTERTPAGEHEEVRTRRDGTPERGAPLDRATDIADADEPDPNEEDVIE
jgi:hypothetical protein